MQKSVWGPSVWYLLHTLPYKLKDEYSSETVVLFSHINSICSNLPCPDCQEHATKVLSMTNKKVVTASKEALINFLHTFHNMVNKKIKKPEFSREALNEKYARANTQNVISHFIQVMSSNMNNDKMMMNSFRRQNYINSFVNYIKQNGYKYNP